MRPLASPCHPALAASCDAGGWIREPREGVKEMVSNICSSLLRLGFLPLLPHQIKDESLA